ncbi:MAG: response regulator [Desulfobacterales bacterium]|nr:response regulator [Desulfobacterales bacterium]
MKTHEEDAGPVEEDRGQRILIIDDDSTSLGVISDYLQGAGFVALAARSGESGIEKARYARPDIIFLDVLMPGIDGFETCRRLKSDPATADIPVIFMTALTDTDDKVKGFEAGAVDYVTKPFQSREVLSRIRMQLRLSALTRELQHTNEELKKHRDHLEELVEERTMEIQTANQQLRDEIAERKRAEEDLRESEERYRDLFENANDLIQSIEPDGTIQYVNPAWRRTLGYTEKETSGLSMFDIIHPDGREHCMVEFRRLTSGEELESIETVFVTREGRSITVEGSSSCLFEEGKPVATRGIFRNITARKQAEEELRQSRNFLQTVIDAIPEKVMVVNRDYTISLANKAMREMLEGKDPVASRLTCHQASYGCERPCAGEKNSCPLYEVIKSKAPMSVTHTHYNMEGKERIVELDAAPVFDQAGEVVQVVESSHDVTERKQVEEQLRQAEKMEAVGQLTGGIAHDFNNLLQAINGYTAVAAICLEAEHPASDSLAGVERVSRRAATLVRQLLAFSRRQALDMKEVNLSYVIVDLIKMIRRVIGEQFTIETIVGRDLGKVRADPGAIGQILVNLCVNARDAMPGGGEITIVTENIRIDEVWCQNHSWARPGRFVLLSVTDTGVGMDEDTLANVFEPFFTTKAVGAGTGLGLSMVYDLVNRHDGMINARGQVGKGATFRIYLPLTEPSAVSEGDRIEGAVPGGTETILLAEDDKKVRELSQTILEHSGYTVLTAADGEEALRVFGEHANEIHLALLDVLMPKLGGKTVLERIRVTRPDLRFLFTSGYNMNAIHTDIVLEEGLALVQKPFQLDDLLRRIREVLDART